MEEYYIGITSSDNNLKVSETLGFKIMDFLNNSTTTSFTIDEQGRLTVTSIGGSETTPLPTDILNVAIGELDGLSDRVTPSVQNDLLSTLTKNTESTNSRLDINNDLSYAKLVLMHDHNQLIAKQIDAINQQNKILETQAQLTHAQNKLILDGIQTKANLDIAKVQVLSTNNQLLNAQNEILSDVGTVQKEKDIILKTKLDFEVMGSETVKNSSDEKIIPIHEKAKYHSEKRIDEERANKTDYSKITQGFIDNAVASAPDEDNAFNLLQDVFTLPSDFKIPNNLVEG